jgi:hypothetical protein
MPQPELLKQKENCYNSTTSKRKEKHKKNKAKYSGKYSQIEFPPVRRNRIALQYATLKEDTSRYQEETQTKLNIQQRRPLTPRKFPARCLCLSNRSDNK